MGMLVGAGVQTLSQQPPKDGCSYILFPRHVTLAAPGQLAGLKAALNPLCLADPTASPGINRLWRQARLELSVMIASRAGFPVLAQPKCPAPSPAKTEPPPARAGRTRPTAKPFGAGRRAPAIDCSAAASIVAIPESEAMGHPPTVPLPFSKWFRTCTSPGTWLLLQCSPLAAVSPRRPAQRAAADPKRTMATRTREQ